MTLQKNKKYLFVGDLHGNVELFSASLQYCKENDYILVCVGDYTDSFYYSRNEQKKLLNLMIEKYEDERTVYLIGNHDLHYIVGVNMQNPFLCSGYSSFAHHDFYLLYNIMINQGMLKFWYHVDNIVATHAGVESMISKTFIKHKDRWEDITAEDVNDMFMIYEDDLYIYLLTSGNRNSHLSPFFDVGIKSGGLKYQGGIFWLRPDEMVFLQNKNENVIQIVGHTPYKFNFETSSYGDLLSEINLFNNFYYIDVLGDPEWYHLLMYDSETKQFNTKLIKKSNHNTKQQSL